MTVVIKPRSAWGANAPKSRTAWTLGQLEGVTVHWWGIPSAPRSADGMPALLRSVQKSHMAPGGLGVPEGGSDIAYNLIIDLWGDAWEGRGWEVQTGANGNSAANRTHIAFCVAMGKGDTVTAAAFATLGRLIREGQGRGIGARVVPHSHWTGTDCPGPQLHEWIGERGWLNVDPRGEEDDVPDWFWPWARWRLLDGAAPDKRPDGIPRKIPQETWTWLSAITDLSFQLGSNPKFDEWSGWYLAGRPDGKRPAGVPARVPAAWWGRLKAKAELVSAEVEKALERAGGDPAEIERLRRQRDDALKLIEAAEERLRS